MEKPHPNVHLMTFTVIPPCRQTSPPLNAEKTITQNVRGVFQSMGEPRTNRDKHGYHQILALLVSWSSTHLISIRAFLFLCVCVSPSHCLIMFSWKLFYFIFVVWEFTSCFLPLKWIQGVDGLRRASNPLPCLKALWKTINCDTVVKCYCTDKNISKPAGSSHSYS